MTNRYEDYGTIPRWSRWTKVTTTLGVCIMTSPVFERIGLFGEYALDQMSSDPLQATQLPQQSLETYIDRAALPVTEMLSGGAIVTAVGIAAGMIGARRRQS